MTKQDQPSDLDLEEIIREFQPKASRREDIMVDTPIQPERPSPKEPDVLVWTPRKRERPKTVSSDTQRMDTQAVRAVAKLDRPASKPVEPFSADWEPQYESPIPDYVPSQPIRFRPRSRLGELQQKLREGPEKIYDKLCQMGLFKLQTAIFLSFLMVVLSGGAIVLHRMGLVQENRMRLLVFSELFAMLLSALLSWERMFDGIFALGKKRFTLETLLVFSFAACIADCIHCLKLVQMPFCAAFCLQCVMAQWAAYHRRITLMDQTDVLRKASRLHRVVKSPDCYEGKPGFHLSEGQVEDFMDHYDKPTRPEIWLDRYALGALLAAVAVGAFGWYRGGVSVGLRTLSAALLAAVPATMFLCQSRPMAILQRRLRNVGALICSWDWVQAARGPGVVVLRDEDLFPGDTLKIHGVKFYTDRNPSTIVGYAEAVVAASGDCLAPVFAQLVQTRHAQRYEVEEFKRYADRGLGGIVCGQSVLLGSRKFLQDMGVELDPAAKVNHAVYMAIDGEFTGVFALSTLGTYGVGESLVALAAQRGLWSVFATGSFLVRKSYLKSQYRVDPDRFHFPGVSRREELVRWAPEHSKGPVCALTTQEGIAPLALSVTGARNLHTAATVGAVVQMLGGGLGLGAVLALTLLGRADLLTPANLLLLELCWAMPGLLISQWTRSL